MIDPHAHLRDWSQSDRETISHGLGVAFKAGFRGVFEMPNTDPALVSREKIDERIRLADDAVSKLGVNIFHGLYAGVTADENQIEEIVKVYDELFPRVVGFKMFAGHSVGMMGIIEKKNQKKIYEKLSELGFKGVLAVHCEKESLIKQGF